MLLPFCCQFHGPACLWNSSGSIPEGPAEAVCPGKEKGDLHTWAGGSLSSERSRLVLSKCLLPFVPQI